MPSVGESAIRELTAGLQSGFMMGQKIKARQAEIAKEKKAVETERWKKGSEAIALHLKFGSSITDPKARQKYYNNAFSTKQFTEDEGLSDLVSGIKDLPVESQVIMTKMAADISKFMKEGDTDSLATTLFQFEAMNAERNWGMDGFITNARNALNLKEERSIIEGEREQAAIATNLTRQMGQEPFASTASPEAQEFVDQSITEAQAKAGLLNKGKGQTININNAKPASAGERTDIAETRASVDSLKNLKSLWDEEFTGPVQGRKGAAKNIFGMNPVKQEAFIAATAAFRNQVIKEITGAQMSEPEAKRILKQVPNETDADSVWLAKYEQSVKNLETLNKRRLEVLRQSGVKAPENSTQSSSGNNRAELIETNKRIAELEAKQGAK